MSAHLERLMQRMGRPTRSPAGRRILELNAEHPAVVAPAQAVREDPEDPRVEGYARLLYDQAVIAEGSKVKDPAAFARRINELLVKDAPGIRGKRRSQSRARACEHSSCRYSWAHCRSRRPKNDGNKSRNLLILRDFRRDIQRKRTPGAGIAIYPTRTHLHRWLLARTPACGDRRVTHV